MQNFEQQATDLEKEEALLQQLKTLYPVEVERCYPPATWAVWPHVKIAALVDIYGGHFPKIQARNEALTLHYSQMLVDCCNQESSAFPPEVKENNPILQPVREGSNLSKEEFQFNVRVLKSSQERKILKSILLTTNIE